MKKREGVVTKIISKEKYKNFRLKEYRGSGCLELNILCSLGQASPMKVISLILTILVNALANAFAQQAGDLDGSFDGDGKIITEVSARDDQIYSVAIQADGKIIAVGYASQTASDWDFAIVRYNTNGSLDSGFGIGGKQITSFGNTLDKAHCVAIQNDGKIVAAGSSNTGSSVNIALVRYNTDGTLDNSFSTDGKLTTSFGGNADIAYSVAFQADGKIVIAGASYNGSYYALAVARYYSNGSTDSSFSTDGRLVTDFNTGTSYFASPLGIQNNGEIIVVGISGSYENYDFALARYHSDGTPDSSFSVDGKLTTDFDGANDEISSMVIQTDGKIVVAGFSGFLPYYDFACARYHPDGMLDSSFGSDGKITDAYGMFDDRAFSIALQPDGKIVSVGFLRLSLADSYDFALRRYNPDGTLDGSFSTDGKLTAEIGTQDDFAYSVAIQPDGKIVAVGSSQGSAFDDFALARFLSGLNVGILSFSPAENILLYPNPIHSNEVLEYSLQQDEVLTIGLYEISGRLVKQFITNEFRSKGSHKESLNFGEGLAAGNYILSITNGNGSIGIKLVKQ